MVLSKKKRILLYLPIFIIIFLVASTNILSVWFGLIVYISTLLFIFLVSIYSDKYLQTYFKFIALTLFVVSLFASLLGFSTHSFQKKLNYNKAVNFIKNIEDFNLKHGRYPKDETEIHFPDSRNGFYMEKFNYYIPNLEKNSYEIKYFHGFWNSKVYSSERKKWYNDD